MPASSPAVRAEWTAARGAAHAALARHGSRLALYDLREALESADQLLPVEFLTALGAVGDASCLASIAAAYARTGGTPTDWWHRHLVDAFRAIVSREQITKRHATAKKVKGGTLYGATDEVGWKSVEQPVHWNDFHATVLHLLGIDHERLTFLHNGIQRRLTNVHGHVIDDILQ